MLQNQSLLQILNKMLQFWTSLMNPYFLHMLSLLKIVISYINGFHAIFQCCICTVCAFSVHTLKYLRLEVQIYKIAEMDNQARLISFASAFFHVSTLPSTVKSLLNKGAETESY